MTLREDTYIETNEQYHEGIAIDEYNGEFSIIRCKKSEDGKIYSRWMKIQIGKDKFSNKAAPWKISFGDRKKAIRIIEQIRDFLGYQDEDSDIPF